MSPLLILVLLSVSSVVLSAELTPAEECLQIGDTERRLQCYDKRLGYQASETDAPSKVQPQPKPAIRFILREKGDLNNFAGADMVDKPGQLNLKSENGTDSSSAKFGVIGAFRPVNDLGWQPFVSAAWNRDTSGTSPKDIRDFSLGITGPLWDPLDPGWTLFPTLRATRRYDQFGSAESNRFGLHVNFVKLSWVNSVPGAQTNSYAFVPHIGMVDNYPPSNGANGGLWRGAYAGFNLAADLNRIAPRLSANLGYEYFVDAAVPDGRRIRQEPYTTLGFSYALTDPEDKSIVFRPAISLAREIGMDVLGGSASTVNRTTLGITLKYN